MNLNDLKKLKGKYLAGKRRGRGIGSGKGGHTSGRGQKGQKSREGHKFSLGFEGGQTPLYKRLPKLGGFRNPTRKDVIGVQLKALNLFENGSTVTVKDLLEKGIIKRMPRHGVKLLSGNVFKKKLTLKGFTLSQTAAESVKKSGSKAVNE